MLLTIHEIKEKYLSEEFEFTISIPHNDELYLVFETDEDIKHFKVSWANNMIREDRYFNCLTTIIVQKMQPTRINQSKHLFEVLKTSDEITNDDLNYMALYAELIINQLKGGK